MVVLMASAAAHSQIVTQNINAILIGPGEVDVDVNSDNIPDYKFDIIPLFDNNQAARVVPYAPNAILDNSTFAYADALNEGDPVEGYFHSNTGVLGTFNTAGNFNGHGDKYLGIRLAAPGGNHYGWIKVNVSQNNDTLKIISCGYNAGELEPIEAGQTVLSISELGDSSVRLYPNPARDRVWIDSGTRASAIRVSDSVGRVWIELRPEAAGSKAGISLATLPGGLYFVLVESAGISTIHRLVVE
jgi:hypothetical protein